MTKKNTISRQATIETENPDGLNQSIKIRRQETFKRQSTMAKIHDENETDEE